MRDSMDKKFVHKRFEYQVARHPERPALVSDFGSVTYRNLDVLANRLAHLLHHLGCSKETIVAVNNGVGIHQVISLLGVFKAGGIYMPLDQTFSEARMAHVYQSCAPKISLVDEGTFEQCTDQTRQHGQEGDLLIKLSASTDTIELEVFSYEGGSFKKQDVPEDVLSTDYLDIAQDGEDGCYIFFTSGSTGVPKAILGAHISLAHFINWEIEEFEITEKDRVSQLTSVTFDAYLRDVFAPLCAGGTLCIPQKETKEHLGRLVSWLDSSQVSIIHCVPSLFRLMIRELESATSETLKFENLREVLTSGEPLYGKDIQRWRACVGTHPDGTHPDGTRTDGTRAEVVNFYGPTETTMIKSFHRIDEIPEDLSKPLHVGKPLPNTFIAIIQNGELCNINEIGEVYIKTPFMTKGYYKDEERTKKVFVQNPFVSDRAELLYKTGDLGRYLPDRSVEILGRLDYQVKVNGVRVELEEIEQSVLNIAGVEETVVMAHHSSVYGNELCCYYTGDELSVADIQGQLKDTLNANLIPGYFIHLEEMPLNINGKIDRKSLPIPESITESFYEAPEGEVEQALEKLWCEVLHRKQVSRNTSFFEIGGHSLKAIQLISQIEKTLNVVIKLSEILDAKTIAEQAVLVAQLPKAAYKSIEKVAEAADYALSHGQKRMWLLNQIKENKVAYNVVWGFELTGVLNHKALEQAFLAMVANHESLRTVFIAREGEPRQVIKDPSDAGFQLRVMSLDGKERQEIIDNEFNTPFELETGPLIRALLVQEDEQRHVLLFSIHHIISDGWSLEVLFHELVENYNRLSQGAQTLDPKTIQYKDYAHWQNEQIASESFESHRDYWHTQFKEEIPVIDLPYDHPRPPVKSFKGEEYIKLFDEELVESLESLSKERGVSLFMLLFSTVRALLYKYTGQQDMVLGTTVAGRDHAALQDQIGFYVNTLALRTKVDPANSFEDFLGEVSEHMMTAFNHQDYPFDMLLDELDIRRDVSRSPLFDVLVELLNIDVYQEDAPEMDGIAVQTLGNGFTVSKFDLSFRFMGSDQFRLVVEYNTDLFHRETIARLLEHYESVLRAIIKNPKALVGDLNLIDDHGKSAVRDLGKGWQVPQPTDKIPDLLREVAKTSPEAIAVSYYAKALNYETLNRQADAMAQYLIENYSIQAGSRVAIMMYHSEWMPVSIMAILKAGAAFVPIDPSVPQQRVTGILEDSDAQLLLTDSRLLFDLHDVGLPLMAVDIQLNDIESQPSAPAVEITNDMLAYMLYTSGTTGKPKGVGITHGSLMNYLLWANEHYFSNEEGKVFGWFTSLAFDLSLTGILSTLIRGDELRIYNSEAPDQALTSIFSDKEGVTSTKLTPSHLTLLAGLEVTPTNTLKCLITGGEALEQRHLDTVFTANSEVRIYNEYGPTEATIGCSVKEVSQGESITIGRPIANSHLLVVNALNQLQPIGLSGELLIGGHCLSSGYWKNEQENTAKFVTIDGERWYRSGDRARWLPNGELLYEGRLDDQVKINGYRIEPEEITRTIEAIDQVTGAVVRPRIVSDQVLGLICYYVGDYTEEDLKMRTSERLPRYMVPEVFMQLEAFPLTANGKIDTKNLPVWTGDIVDNYAAPADEKERLLAAVYSQVLDLEKVGVLDNFFHIGGDSIKAIQIASRVHSEGYALQVEDIFQHPDIRTLATWLRASTHEVSQAVVTGEVPLSPVQAAFFDRKLKTPGHFNQAVMFKTSERLHTSDLSEIFITIQEHHDALRISYPQFPDELQQTVNGLNHGFYLEERDFTEAENPGDRLEEAVESLQSGIDIRTGPLMRVGLYRLPDGDRLLIVVHHLVMDGVSWRVLLEDLELLYQGRNAKNKKLLAKKTDSLQAWNKQLQDYASSEALRQESAFWVGLRNSSYSSSPIPSLMAQQGKISDTKHEGFLLSKEETHLLQNEVHQAYNTKMNDILLAALLAGIRRSTDVSGGVMITLEGHGRERLTNELDISRTIGWFTSQYPVLLNADGDEPATVIRQVKENLRSVPKNGIGYGILNHMASGTAFEGEIHTQLSFNYLGEFRLSLEAGAFELADESVGNLQSPEDPRWHDLEVIGLISDGQLDMKIYYDQHQFRQEEIAVMMQSYHEALKTLIDHCVTVKVQVPTPSDFTYGGLSFQQLGSLMEAYPVQDIYPLSPLQEGIYYHSILEENPANYFEQISYSIKGNIRYEIVEQSVNELLKRHESLRSAFVYKGYPQPLQVVLKERKVDFEVIELSENDPEQLRAIKEADKARSFDLEKDTLFRIKVIALGGGDFEIIWSHHHIVMDGWCNTILTEEYFTIYDQLVAGQTVQLPRAPQYKDFVYWLQARRSAGQSHFWQHYFKAFGALTGLPRINAYDQAASTVDYQREWYHLDAERCSQLQQLAKANNCTLNSVVHALWAILLGKYNAGTDVAFGAVVSGRPSDLPGVEQIVGLFINTIPVRVNYEDDWTFTQLLTHVQEQAIQCKPYHQDSLSGIAGMINRQEDLIDHIITYENYPIAKRTEELSEANDSDAISSLELQSVEIFEQTNYDFNIVVFPDNELIFRFDFNASVYRSSYIDKLRKDIDMLATQFISEPKQTIKDMRLSKEKTDVAHDDILARMMKG